MKITTNPDLPIPKIPLSTSKPTKLTRKPRRRVPAGPTTPLLKWNFSNEDEEEEGSGGGGEVRRKSRKDSGGGGGVSVRKLGAALWRMQTEAMVVKEDGGGGGGGGGFKPGIGHGGEHLSCHHGSRECGSESKDPLRSPGSVNGPVSGYRCERQSPFQYTNYAMEGATKWDPVNSKPSNENPDNSKLLDDQKANATMISALESELEQARARIEELELEKRSSKKKVEHFLKKLSEERTTWRSKEHEKVRAIIDDIKHDLNRERKNRQRLEKVNSKLVNDLAEVKLSAKRYMQDYEKERKARVLIEEVCDELAKEIGEDKAEVDSLKQECMKIREEVDDERKMLQMAEVWREERVQMKLVDAKVALDQKYSQMNYLVEELENFLKSKGVNLDSMELKQAEFLQRSTSSMNIKDIQEFTYEPSNAEDIYTIVEEMAMAENNNDREIEYSPASHVSKVRTVSPENNSNNCNDIHRVSNMYGYPSGEIDDEDDDDDDNGSGWETVSHVEDRGSSYSREGSILSVNNRMSGSCSEWEEQIGDISEISSVPCKQVKKVKSISRLWKSGHSNNDERYKTIPIDGVHGKLSNNGRVSNGSPEKDGFSPSEKMGWISPETGNPHINRGMKGCIEWPRGGLPKGSLKNKLLEARMESQKIQLRQVLKQKI